MNWRKPPEILKRRAAERDLFARGIYPTDPITVWGVTTDYKVVWRAQRKLRHSEALALLRGSVVPDLPPADEIQAASGLGAIITAIVSAILSIFGGKK